MDDVLTAADLRCMLADAVGLGVEASVYEMLADVRSLRAKVAELEAEHEWISERCADCGHRFAYPSNYCAQCSKKVGPTEPDVYPELCECPRCIVARNVAMDAALSARGGEDGA